MHFMWSWIPDRQHCPSIYKHGFFSQIDGTQKIKELVKGLTLNSLERTGKQNEFLYETYPSPCLGILRTNCLPLELLNTSKDTTLYHVPGISCFLRTSSKLPYKWFVDVKRDLQNIPKASRFIREQWCFKYLSWYTGAWSVKYDLRASVGASPDIINITSWMSKMIFPRFIQIADSFSILLCRISKTLLPSSPLTAIQPQLVNSTIWNIKTLTNFYLGLF